MDHINPDGRNLAGETVPVPPLLHLYAGASNHDSAYVVGTAAGLVALRDAITRALDATGNSKHNASVSTTPNGKDVFVADGEGYQVVVIRLDAHWRDSLWQRLVLPYVGYDDQQSDPIMPWELLRLCGAVKNS